MLTTFKKPLIIGASTLALALTIAAGPSAPALAAADAATNPPTTQTTQTTVSKDEGGISADAARAWESIKNHSADKRDQALTAGEDFLKAIDRDLAALKAKAATANEAVKADLAKREEALRVARNDFAASVDALREDSGDAWEKVVDRMSGAYRDLSNGFKDAWEELKS